MADDGEDVPFEVPCPQNRDTTRELAPVLVADKEESQNQRKKWRLR